MKTKYAVFDVPANKTKAEGECGTTVNQLTVSWNNDSVMILEFDMNSTTKLYRLDNLNISFGVDLADAKGKKLQLFRRTKF